MDFQGNFYGFRKSQDAEGLSRIVVPEVRHKTPKVWYSYLQYKGIFKHTGMTINHCLCILQN
jgi:hypothetical protein